ncbi:hypothetical protein J3Q64DRAFT_1696185 [Phycomyces blakesleeanus]|uniref:Uncharacterized protein n=2 Tax=Phycomyces blakesleeanus TaxID=4837 RepID=A0A162Q8M3_PHYB8|nr:hypothetical protein PHYBLDRAFT_62058 [Phycomyces blakesleeanus NRRL 1555(-)]OAD81016.1 hypothetical protein PHYBLDRAFT_62058 [Phycomyces blakesleeanus NRRL 1555(-)]|eukprot:XP_018299056.1 hypothetical protein PHYBLDRAFT_62058 [Phycomyces blakesleeanus NRRL 1555(-)]
MMLKSNVRNHLDVSFETMCKIKFYVIQTAQSLTTISKTTMNSIQGDYIYRELRTAKLQIVMYRKAAYYTVCGINWGIMRQPGFEQNKFLIECYTCSQHKKVEYNNDEWLHERDAHQNAKDKLTKAADFTRQIMLF